ncbi:MAG: LysM peptidoglycan-binding domain-containing protein [Anaerolineae bacterium]|nr:LysM peptidoglycan-binding domain-containing protein [Anaerolineae bacterium]
MRKVPRQLLFPTSLVLACLVVAASLALVAPAFAQGGGQTSGFYVVQPGDSLSSIAVRYNVSLSELATINGLYDVHRVFVGQVLRLPPPLPPGFTQPPITPPTQPQPPIVQPPVVFPPVVQLPLGNVVGYRNYIVRQGDNLSSIAVRFGSSIQAIMAYNGLANANFIFTGQRLTIPILGAIVYPPQPRPQPRPSGRYYVVQPGDTLFAIAHYFGRNAWDIAKLNGILNLNHIFIGQVLRIR